jgi:hypothetical protein
MQVNIKKRDFEGISIIRRAKNQGNVQIMSDYSDKLCVVCGKTGQNIIISDSI